MRARGGRSGITLGLGMLVMLAACGTEDPGAIDFTAPGVGHGLGAPDPGPAAADYASVTNPGAIYFADYDDNGSGPGDPIVGNDTQLAWGTLQTTPRDKLYVGLYEGWGTFASVPFDGFALPLTIDIGADPDEQNYDTCGTCISVLEDVTGNGDYVRQLVATSGTIEITALPTHPGDTFTAVLRDVVLEEIDLDGLFVSGGATSRVIQVELSTLSSGASYPPGVAWVPQPCGGAVHCVSEGESIQDAVDAASAGDVVQIAGGTFDENVQILSKPLTVVGGHAADFASWDPGGNQTVVFGPAGSVFYVADGAGSTLRGLVITGGTGTCAFGNCDGGGLFLLGGPYTVTDNTFVDNDLGPEGQGGGLFLLGSATIADNVFVNNRGGRGGAVAASVDGLATIANNFIYGNWGRQDHGGGVYLAGTDIVLTGNLIQANEIGLDTGYGWGGGGDVLGLGTHVYSSRNVFTGNTAPSAGSGLFVDDQAHLVSENDLFYRNTCTPDGGYAIFVDGFGATEPSELTLINATIADHECPETFLGSAVYVQNSSVRMRNSIVYNSGPPFFLDGGTAAVTYSMFEDVVDGTGNFLGDPLFVDPLGGDYHLQSTAGHWDTALGSWVIDPDTSPGVDSGMPGDSFAGEPAPNGGRRDLGHTGNTAEASLSP